MPMPHRTFAEVAKRRLVGKEGSERVATINGAARRSCRATGTGRTPTCGSGSRASSIDTRVRAKVVHRDSLQVRREGAAQIALVGAAERRQVVAPAGALAHPDQDGRLRVHDAPTRPCADADRRRARAARRDPGSDRGRARGSWRRPGAARRAPERRRDRVVPGGEPPRRTARASSAPRSRPPGSRSRSILARRRRTSRRRWPRAAPPMRYRPLAVVPVSVLDDESLDRLREAIWGLTGLIRVFPRARREVDDEPFALPIGATVADLADRVHHELGARVHRGARLGAVGAVRRPARRPRSRPRSDGDVVEVVTR